MSRSIHTTVRSLREARDDDYRDAAEKRRRIHALEEDLEEKRQIKWRSSRGRRTRIARPTGRVVVPSIRILDSRSSVHFPASAADLENVLRRLPRGVAEGIADIRLELGREVQLEHAREKDRSFAEPDPHVGRLGWELFPGVFSGDILGQYRPGAGRIRVYAFVYADDLPERAIVEPYLRLRMLATFVHEVAHHLDECWRVARGRWRNEGDKAEQYAEHMEHDWVAEHVIPYLLETYREDYARLSRFLVEHGGVDIPLDVLAGDPRTTAGNGRVIWRHPAWEALGSILEGRRADHDPREIRLAVALDLLWAGENELALTATESVLADDPAHVEGRLSKARVLEAMTLFDEALELADAVLADDPESPNALETKSLVAFSAWRWLDVAESIAARERVAPSAVRWTDRLREARALMELERWVDFDSRIAALAREHPDYRRAHPLGLAAIGLLRRERLDEALALAECGLREFSGMGGHHIFEAVRIDVFAQRGIAAGACALLPSHIARMKRAGYGAWAERIEALARL